MTLSAAKDRVKDIKELTNSFDVVIVDDHDFDQCVLALDELRREKQKEKEAQNASENLQRST